MVPDISMHDRECLPCFGDMVHVRDCVLAPVAAQGYDLQEEPVDEHADACDEGAEEAACGGRR